MASPQTLAATSPLDLQRALLSGIPPPLRGTLWQILSASKKEKVATFFNNGEFEKIAEKFSLEKISYETFQMKSLLSFPLMLENGETFSFCFYSRRPDIYNSEHITLLHRLEKALKRNTERTQSSEKSVDDPFLFQSITE